MSLRTATLFGTIFLTLGWALGSLTTPPVASVQTLPARDARRAAKSVEPPAPYAELLQLRLGQAPAPPTPRRNPFVFGTRPRTIAPVADARVETEPTTVVAPVEDTTPPGPSVDLLGIGSKTTPQGVVRTAVVSDGETVHLVKAGDVIVGFKVVEVTEESATLENAAGARWQLRLR